MYCYRKVTEDLYWVGANDRRLMVFEGVYHIPTGVSYNSYLLLDEKTVLFDTVDKAVGEVFFENVEHLLGGRTLEVFELPGHTPGSIVLLLREDRVLFTGDAINHHLWLQLDGCSPLPECVKALDRLMFLEDRADYILHGHARDKDDISLMRCMRNGIEEICDGKTAEDKPYKWFDGEDMQHAFSLVEGKQYSTEDSVICYRK